MLDTCSDHLGFDLGRRAPRHRVRFRGTVIKTGLSLGVEAVDPAMGALTRDAHRFSNMCDRHPLVTDAFYEQTTAMKGETGITMRHEDLRLSEATTPLHPEVFTTSNRHQRPRSVQLAALQERIG